MGKEAVVHNLPHVVQDHCKHEINEPELWNRRRRHFYYLLHLPKRCFNRPPLAVLLWNSTDKILDAPTGDVGGKRDELSLVIPYDDHRERRFDAVSIVDWEIYRAPLSCQERLWLTALFRSRRMA